MGEIGQVIKIENDRLIVRLQRTEACAKCKACSAGMSKEDMFINAKNLCNARIDDFVNIELEQADFLKAVLIMYGIPLISLMFGFISGFYGATWLGLSANAAIGFAVGVLCMLIAFLWIKSREEYWKSKDFIPMATEVVK